MKGYIVTQMMEKRSADTLVRYFIAVSGQECPHSVLIPLK